MNTCRMQLKKNFDYNSMWKIEYLGINLMKDINWMKDTCTLRLQNIAEEN